MRNVLDKACRENQNTYFASDCFSECLAFCEIMWEIKMVEADRSQMTKWRCLEKRPFAWPPY
jgi:hypothetical protein